MGHQVLRLLGAGLAQEPTAWLMMGVAVAVFGLAPRLTVGASWGALAVAALVSIVGPLLRLNHWVLDISPFVQAPKLPGTAFTATSLLWLTGVGAVLVAIGLTALRHRDIG